MEGLFQKITEECRKTGFLEAVLGKAHYAPEDRELLWSVLEQVLKCMEGEANWSARPVCGAEVDSDGRPVCTGERDFGGKTVCTGEADYGAKQDGTDGSGVQAVVMTLGAGVDQLQEKMLSEGKLTEAYMVEVLGSEILLLAYAAYNAWVEEHTDAVVKRYYFLGMGDYVTMEDVDRKNADADEGKEKGMPYAKAPTRIPLGLSALPGILKRCGLPVTCTDGYCMIPKKSVAFYAELTKDKAAACEGICMGCGRGDCPNRMASGNRTQGNRTLDRPLTYGYARILGLFS